MQSSFLRRYLKYILIAASNWHDKRVIASGWHFSHPSCHWKHNALAIACSSGTCVQSQSLGHANRAVACCLLLFVAPSQQPKNWEEGITLINCSPWFKHVVEWMAKAGYLWNILSSKTWHCQCNIKQARRLCFASDLVCFAQNKEKYSSIECTRKKVWFLKNVICCSCKLSCMYFVIHLICKKGPESINLVFNLPLMQ